MCNSRRLMYANLCRNRALLRIYWEGVMSNIIKEFQKSVLHTSHDVRNSYSRRNRGHKVPAVVNQFHLSEDL